MHIINIIHPSMLEKVTLILFRIFFEILLLENPELFKAVYTIVFLLINYFPQILIVHQYQINIFHHFRLARFVGNERILVVSICSFWSLNC